MANVYAVANGNWSAGATWNTGSVPTSADDVFANNFTVNVDVNASVLSLRNSASSPIVAGGSFNFNTPGITFNVTGAIPTFSGATNLLQIIATSGSVTINFSNNVGFSAASNGWTLILYNGSCNFNTTAPLFFGNTFASNSTQIINKSSTGLLTLIGNSVGSTVANGSNRTILNSAGNVVIVGNVTGGSAVNSNICISLAAGLLSVTGVVTGGSAAVAIDSAVAVDVVGNVTAGNVAAITSTSAIPITINGTVTASATANAISLTNAASQVYLNGNMVNVNGKMGIYAPIVWLDRTNTTRVDFFTSGGVARVLYSENTFPNLPPVDKVRHLTAFGPGLSLIGTNRIPNNSDVASGVQVDTVGNTGTAIFTLSSFLSALSTEASNGNPIAIRLLNGITPEIMVKIIASFKQ